MNENAYESAKRWDKVADILIKIFGKENIRRSPTT